VQEAQVLKGAVRNAEKEIAQREISAERIQRILEEERKDADSNARAMRAAVARAKADADEARQDAASTSKLNEALQVSFCSLFALQVCMHACMHAVALKSWPAM
jgi:ATP:corrinoid adenosyltransferase